MQNENLIATAPAVVTRTHKKRSDSYQMIRTADIVDILRSHGYVTLDVVNEGVRRRGIVKEHGKHYVQMTLDPEQRMFGGEYRPDLILTSSHDGSASFRAHLALTRLSTGMTLIASSEFSIRFYHSSKEFTPEYISERILELTQKWEDFKEAVAVMMQTELGDEEVAQFAKEATMLRVRSLCRDISGYDSGALLARRRQEDIGNSVWNTLNVVYENAVLGGIRLVPSSRPIRSLTDAHKLLSFSHSLWNNATTFTKRGCRR